MKNDRQVNLFWVYLKQPTATLRYFWAKLIGYWQQWNLDRWDRKMDRQYPGWRKGKFE
jgi:hypothetical protein